MELLAAITGLSALKEPCEVELYSDSQYLVNAFLQGWLENWKKKNFKKGTRDEVKNIDLWEELSRLTEIHSVSFIWVKGHDGHPENERCDALATAAADSFRAESEEAPF
jgi:ribonuclease HI